MGLCLISLYLILGVITLVYYLWRKNNSYWKDRNVICEDNELFTGSLKGIRTKRHISECIISTYTKFKGTAPFIGFYLFMQPVAFILDLDLVKNILIKDFTNFTDRGSFHNERDDPLTAHLFSLDGQKWKSMRTKLSPTFTSGKMKFMFSTVINVGKQFGDVMEENIKNDSVVEMKELLARFTTDVIGSCAFGIDCNSLKDPNAEFRQMGKLLFTERRNNKYVSMFITSYPKLAASLRMKQLPDRMSNFFLRVFRETVEYREKNNIKKNDFMDLLIEMKNNKFVTSGDNDEKSTLTMEQMAAQSFVFFIAGFETSSTTMGFLLHELAQNVEIQDKLRKEILDIIAKHNGEVTYDAIAEMKYLNKVICETLRKYSVLPHLIRKAITDYPVPNTNHIIEKNTLVLIPVSGIHKDPEIYPNPDVFDPERFTPEEIQKRHPTSWLPFGDGPRNCIGLRFGKMQTSVGIIELLRRFKFSICSKTDVPVKISPQSFLLASQGGIYLNVEKI